jgi:IS30 family transposase
VGYSVREASTLLGRRADALRREIERHTMLEGGQLVARLAGGITAYRRKDGGRWLISIPAHLGA